MPELRQINIPGDAAQKVFEKAAEMFPELIEEASNFIADKAQEFWITTARAAAKRKDGSLSLWGEEYAKTIKVILSKKRSGAKVYVDESHPSFRFVEMIEKGVSTWNIKNALLQGKAARRNQALYGTLFVRVPFRYRIPGVTKAMTGFAGIMPRSIYEKVKKGEAIGEEAGEFAGLVKVGGPLHSQFMVFRTVSEKSEGWIYPGKEGISVFTKVKKKIEQMIDETIENIIMGFLKDLKEQGV
jgi:hypothetical protein